MNTNKWNKLLIDKIYQSHHVNLRNFINEAAYTHPCIYTYTLRHTDTSI